MGGKKKNRRAESRPTGGADPVVTSTPIEGSEPAVTYLSAPDSRSSQSLADLARGNDATVHLPSMDAGGSGTQVEAGVQPETVFADMIITAPPPDLSTPPVQDAERQVEMFDIRTPPQQRNYIKFTCPLTNRAWHWDVETEDWFFEDEAEQSGWAGLSRLGRIVVGGGTRTVRVGSGRSEVCIRGQRDRLHVRRPRPRHEVYGTCWTQWHPFVFSHARPVLI